MSRGRDILTLYSLRMVRVRVINSWQKCDFSLKNLNYYLNVKNDVVYIKNDYFWSKKGGKGQLNADYFFQLNLPPPFLLRSQGDNIFYVSVSRKKFYLSENRKKRKKEEKKRKKRKKKIGFKWFLARHLCFYNYLFWQR